MTFLLIGIPVFGLTLYVIKVGGAYFFLWAWIFLFMTSVVRLSTLSSVFFNLEYLRRIDVTCGDLKLIVFVS